jgi:hypothetical protein
MKSNFTSLLIPICNHFKNDCDSCNELDVRCDIFKIKISHDRNSKLCENFFFVFTKQFLMGEMKSYELGWENLAFISMVLAPQYLKLILNGLIKLFVI